MTGPKFGNCKVEATLRQEAEGCGDGGDKVLLEIEFSEQVP